MFWDMVDKFRHNLIYCVISFILFVVVAMFVFDIVYNCWIGFDKFLQRVLMFSIYFALV